MIVPVHGWAPYLAETLDAVLAENPDEVVVVDDGSRRPVQAPGLRILRLAARRGLAGARAAGFAELGGCELIALCDADDVWTPGSLQARVDAIGDAAACVARAEIVGPDNRPTGERWDSPVLSLPGLYERNRLCVSSALLVRAAVEDAGGLESDLPRAEDWDLWLRLVAAGHRLAYAENATVRYRRRAGALSADIAELARSQMILHERHRELVDDDTFARVRRADLLALVDGLVRQRRYGDAREALREAGARDPVLAIPGLRVLRGRRDPYRR